MTRGERVSAEIEPIGWRLGNVLSRSTGGLAPAESAPSRQHVWTVTACSTEGMILPASLVPRRCEVVVTRGVLTSNRAGLSAPAYRSETQRRGLRRAAWHPTPAYRPVVETQR